MMMISRLRYRCSGCGYTTLQRKRIGDHVDGHRRDAERQRAGQQDEDAEKDPVGSSAQHVRILIQIEDKESKPKCQQVKRKRRCWTDDLLHLLDQVDEPEVGEQQKTSPDNTESLPVKGAAEPRGNDTSAAENSSGKGQKALGMALFNQSSNYGECSGQGVVRNSPAEQPHQLHKGPRNGLHVDLPHSRTWAEHIQVERRDTCRDATVSNAHQFTNSGGDTTQISHRDSTVTVPPLQGMVGAGPQKQVEDQARSLDSQCCTEKSSAPPKVILTTPPNNGMDDATSLTSVTEDSRTEEQSDGTPVITDVFSISEYQETIKKLQPDISRGLSETETRRLKLSHLHLEGLEPRKASPPQREIQSAPPALHTQGARVGGLALEPDPTCSVPVSTASGDVLVVIQSNRQANSKTSSNSHGMQELGETMTDSQNTPPNGDHYRSGGVKDQRSPENIRPSVYKKQPATEASVPAQQGIDMSVTSSNAPPLTTYGNVASSTVNGGAPGTTKFRTIAPKPCFIDQIRPYYVGESRIFRCFQCPFMCLEKKLLLMHMREEQCYSGLVRRESAMEALKALKEGHTAIDTAQLQASNETCHGGTPIIAADKSVPSPAANIEVSSDDGTPEEDTNTALSVVPIQPDNNNVKADGSPESIAKAPVEKIVGPADDLIPIGTTFPTEVKFPAFKRPITIRNQQQADKLREILQHEHLKARFMQMLKVRLKRALTVVNRETLGGTGVESNGDEKSQTNVQGANVTTGSRCNTHAKVSSSPALSPIPEVSVKKEPALVSCCSHEPQVDQKVTSLPATPSKSVRGGQTSTAERQPESIEPSKVTPVPATPSKSVRGGQTSTAERQPESIEPPKANSITQASQKRKSPVQEDHIVYVGQDCGVQRARTTTMIMTEPPQISATDKLQSAVVEALREKLLEKQHTFPTNRAMPGTTPSNVGQLPVTVGPLAPSPLDQLTRLTHEPYLVNKSQNNAILTGGSTTAVSVSHRRSVAMPRTTTVSPERRHAAKRGGHPDVVECSPPKYQALQQNISFGDFQHLVRRHPGEGGNFAAVRTNVIYAPQPQGVDPRIPLRPLVGSVANTQNYSVATAIPQNPSTHTGKYPFQQQLERIKDTADQSMAYKYCNGTTHQNDHVLHPIGPTRAWPPSRSPMNTTSPLDFQTEAATKHPAYHPGPPPQLHNGTPPFNPPFMTQETGNGYTQISRQDTETKRDDTSPEPMDLRVNKRRPSPPPLIRIKPSYHPPTTVTPSAVGPPCHNGWTRRDDRLAFNVEPKSHINSRERLAVLLNEIETSVRSDYAAQRRTFP
ncbi:uncharacterized protein LOC144921576 isoform X2 [Branchiostoma floridae x Branchiostoma belcheri]